MKNEIKLLSETRHVLRLFEELAKDLNLPLQAKIKDNKLVLKIPSIGKIELDGIN